MLSLLSAPRSLRVLALLLLLSLPAASRGQTSIPVGGPTAEIEENRLEAALRQSGSIDFVETPLRDVADSLSRQFGVPIVLAQKKLEEAAVLPDTPITKTLNHLPLESALRLILKDLELGLTIRDNVIVITSEQDIESQMMTRVYPVLDLVAQSVVSEKDGKTIKFTDPDSLIEVITTTLKPDSWDDVGGPGAIDYLDNAGALIVSQTRDIHGQLDNLLFALRRARAIQGIPSLASPPTRPDSAAIGSRYSPSTRAMGASAPLPTWQLPQTYRSAD
jgi:hypothetical protein